MTIRKSNTKLSVDQIIDGAADVLENGVWVTGVCADSDGGHCAVGAVCRAVYPKATWQEISDLAYPDTQPQYTWENTYEAMNGRKPDPRHLEALAFLAKRFGAKSDPDTDYRPFSAPIFKVNDELPSGELTVIWNEEQDRYVPVWDEKVRLQSSRKIVRRFRNAAAAYRKQQANAQNRAAA